MGGKVQIQLKTACNIAWKDVCILYSFCISMHGWHPGMHYLIVKLRTRGTCKVAKICIITTDSSVYVV